MDIQDSSNAPGYFFLNTEQVGFLVIHVWPGVLQQQELNQGAAGELTVFKTDKELKKMRQANKNKFKPPKTKKQQKANFLAKKIMLFLTF